MNMIILVFFFFYYNNLNYDFVMEFEKVNGWDHVDYFKVKYLKSEEQK